MIERHGISVPLSYDFAHIAYVQADRRKAALSKLIAKFKSVPRKDKIKFGIFIAFILITITVALFLLPNIIALKDKVNRDLLKDQILSFGVWGWLIFAALQVFQIIFAVIPGEPIEVIGCLPACLVL